MSEEQTHDGRGTDDGDAEADHEGQHDGSTLSPGESDAAPHRRRRRRWPWVVFALVASLIATAFLLPLPYRVNSAGVVRSTEPLITVADGHGYPSKSSILFLTVSEQRATPAALLWAWLDDTVDVEEIKDETPERDRQQTIVNKKAMEQSKLDAIYVAYKKLGLEVSLTGSGAFVVALQKGMPAERVMARGDVITAVDGRTVTVSDDVRASLVGKPVGTKVALTIKRHGSGASERVEVVLGRNESDPSRGFLGVQLETADQSIKVPFSTTIDSGEVVGPSAGLAFTLGVIDRLTPGDLVGDRTVAVTGEIGLDGSVGAIGGIAQKIAGAKEAGATEFLYPASTPADEVARVRTIAGSTISLHPVATLDDALQVLAPGGVPLVPHA